MFATHENEQEEGVPRSRTDWATDRLREAILTGDFEPGEFLRAAALAERWQLSQTPLREAFQRLAAEGLVVQTPQRPVRVAPVSIQEMAELYELRGILEPMAIVRSIERADEEWRRDLTEHYERLAAWSESLLHADYASYERDHIAFHRTLRARCDSVWLIRLVNMLADQSTRYRAWIRGARAGTAKVLQEHRDLYEACVGGDRASAAEVTVEHLRLAVEAAERQVAASTDAAAAV